MKKLFAILWILLAAGLITQVQPKPPGPSGDRFFPVAVWYSGGKARAPTLEKITPRSREEWRADLKKIKALGFNTVRTWVEWNTAEPRRGEYHLENLDLLLKLAQDEGLKVIVQFYADSAPEWVGQAFPDGAYVAQNGEKLHSQAAPGYCFDHAGVRAAELKFFQEVARHASSSPAFYAWDLWSEPAILNWAEIGYIPNATFCYCPSSMARFRQWLKRKYGTLEALNEAWHRSFNDWQQVEPPRFGTILTYTDYMDWKTYIGDKIAADLKARNDAVKQIDPTHITSSHAPNPSPLARTLADIDASDDFLMKDSVDYFGTSFYPKLTSPERDWSLQRRALAMDLVHAVTGDRGFYVGELQAGYGVHGVISGNEITPQELELNAWSMVARGAKAINYYAFYPMDKGYEAGGYGLIDLDGTVTERARRAGATAQTIASHSQLLLDAKPVTAEAAVIFNPLTPLLGGEQPYGSRTAIHQSVAGYHRMFFERNVPLDVLSSRELSAERLQSYKLVIAPYPLLMTAQMARLLGAYVSAGGHLFVEARPGWVDERGYAQPILPGFGWQKMFGVREQKVIPRKDFSVSWGEAKFPAMTFQERFEPVGEGAVAVATAEDGQAVAYQKKFGKGEAILFGSFAGQANQLKPVEMNPLGGILIDWAGIAPAELSSNHFVELRRMKTPGGEIIFLFNHGQQDATVDYRFPDAIKSLSTLAGSPQQASGRTPHLAVQVPAQEVRIFVAAF